jgi:predicted 3-demethylubiquinone-9 3-methyltransferase (glyoxalase superfamily)
MIRSCSGLDARKSWQGTTTRSTPCPTGLDSTIALSRRSESFATHSLPSDYPSGKAGDVLMVESRLPAFLVSALTAVPRSSITKPSRSRSPPTISTRPTATGTPSSANGGQESECGWCKDKWGVSWQITPRVLTRCPFSTGVGCFHHRPIITRMQAARG